MFGRTVLHSEAMFEDGSSDLRVRYKFFSAQEEYFVEEEV